MLLHQLLDFGISIRKWPLIYCTLFGIKCGHIRFIDLAPVCYHFYYSFYSFYTELPLLLIETTCPIVKLLMQIPLLASHLFLYFIFFYYFSFPVYSLSSLSCTFLHYYFFSTTLHVFQPFTDCFDSRKKNLRTNFKLRDATASTSG